MNLLDIINKAKAEKAKTLDLSQQGLRLLPPELFEIQSLEELNLDRNKLVELPDDLGMLTNLKSLSVSENCKWRIRKKFSEGECLFLRMYGYRFTEGGLKVVPEEADVVRHIYSSYLGGIVRSEAQCR